MKLPLNFEQLTMIRKLAITQTERLKQQPSDASLFEKDIRTCEEIVAIIDHCS